MDIPYAWRVLTVENFYLSYLNSSIYFFCLFKLKQICCFSFTGEFYCMSAGGFIVRHTFPKSLVSTEDKSYNPAHCRVVCRDRPHSILLWLVSYYFLSFLFSHTCVVLREKIKVWCSPMVFWVIPKTQKMVLDAALLNTQHKVRIKGKVEQFQKRSSAFSYTSV